MSTQAERRAELADFLKARRQQVDRGELALPAGARGRTTGLRREEVAFLAGMSVTWYTWLEQARDIHPSRQVLEAVARTLRLTVREHAYVLELAGYSAAHLGDPPIVRNAPRHVQRLLDALAEYPAYAIAPDWGISGWNQAYQALYPNVASVSSEQRNLLWLVFTDPYVRQLLPHWDIDSRHFLAQFRAEAGPRLGDPAFAYLVSRLLDISDAFRKAGRVTPSNHSPPASGGSITPSSVTSSSNTTAWPPLTNPTSTSSSTPPWAPKPSTASNAC